MAVYSLTNKGNVVKCKWNCSANHEHYQGTFDGALKYFGVSEVKSWGNLMNIVIYHQTSDRTFPKLSNELFDILVHAQSDHKYWAAALEREENALKVLDEAEKAGLIYDSKLLPMLESSERKASRDRAWACRRWMKSG